MFYVRAASGMLFQEVLELQVQYMIDSKNGGRLVYSNACGLTVYLYMIKILGLIGNGKLWMVLLRRHLLGEKGTGTNPTDRAKSGTKRSMTDRTDPVTSFISSFFCFLHRLPGVQVSPSSHSGNRMLQDILENSLVC